MQSGRSKPLTIDADLLQRWPLPRLEAGADKHARGNVLIVGGSSEIPGAVLLAGTAALRAGAGRVQIATVRSAAPALAIAFPESRVLGLAAARSGELALSAARALDAELDDCAALLLGPGMRTHHAANKIFERFTSRAGSAAVVLDAAALRLVARDKRASLGKIAGVIATPHAGEMADLWGCSREQVEREPLALARRAARTLGVVIVLKGAVTYVAAPDGRALRNTAGNQGLATAGSGDTLAGIIAGLAARGAEPLCAAAWGVWLHAKAGEALARKVGPLGYLARELAAEVPALLALPAKRSAASARLRGRARRS